MMACSRCNGYYSCGCHILKMKEDLRIKKMEVELLQYKIKEEITIFNNINEGSSRMDI